MSADTEAIRFDYAYAMSCTERDHPVLGVFYDRFNSWLAEHDREVAVATLDQLINTTVIGLIDDPAARQAIRRRIDDLRPAPSATSDSSSTGGQL